MSKNSSEFENFVAVPYRKAGLEQSAQSSATSAPSNKKNKKGNRGSHPVPAQGNRTGPSAPSRTTDNPFSQVFSLSEANSGTANDESVPASGMEFAVEEPSTRSSKQKFVPLFTAHGSDLQIKLQGRHPCQCMCTRHNLINNCINCGRIVCEQEASGPCFTCGNLVCTLEEAAALRRGGLDAERTRRKIYGSEELTLDFKQMVKLDGTSDTKSLAKAEAHKEMLLEFDRTAAQRTKIIDDQADYFKENAFMTADQRKALREKEKELRAVRFASKSEKNRKFDLDIAGREFKSQGDEISTMYSEADEPSQFTSVQESLDTQSFFEAKKGIAFPAVPSQSLEEELAAIPNLQRPTAALAPSLFRLQDRELQEMSDPGMALSIQQPWASFVVMGFKPHEGRDFYSAHRGKLWIASGSKILPPNEIIQQENLTKVLLNEDLLVFPEQYLTGFLLGCVDLVDCITQEEYQRRYPGGLLEYPYIFLFENPMELERKFPVSGKAKIFNLDHRLHELAKRQPTKRPLKKWQL